MASTLTYTDFAAHIPQLATSNTTEQANILGCIQKAELVVNRDILDSSIPPRSTVSQADMAVLYMTAHLYVLECRALQNNLAVPGQVTAETFGDFGVTSFKPIPSGSASEATLRATHWGNAYLELITPAANDAIANLMC